MNAEIMHAAPQAAPPDVQIGKSTLRACYQEITSGCVRQDWFGRLHINATFMPSKVNGFDVKALRSVVRLRKQDINERKEQEAILETYLHALGMLN